MKLKNLYKKLDTLKITHVICCGVGKCSCGYQIFVEEKDIQLKKEKEGGKEDG